MSFLPVFCSRGSYNRGAAFTEALAFGIHGGSQGSPTKPGNSSKVHSHYEISSWDVLGFPCHRDGQW